MSQKLLLSLGLVAGILIPNTVLAQQVTVQQGSASATAVGEGNFAASRVHQSAAQNQHGNPNAYVNGQGQVINQQAHGSATAVGQDNVVISDIDQRSVQNQYGNYGDPNSQQAVQNATNNAAAIGRNNTVVNTTRQYNLQNQWSY